MIKQKKGSLSKEILIYIIIIGILTVYFTYEVGGRTETKGIKQQVIEKQTALLISSAEPGMTFTIKKESLHGIINKLELKEGRVYAVVEGLPSIIGYPYFTQHEVRMTETEEEYKIIIT